MGHLFADQYSLLHFASGVIMYFWYVPFVVALLGHIFFEYVEIYSDDLDIIVFMLKLLE